MKSPCRDLLVLTNKLKLEPEEFERHVELLNNLLYQVESFNIFCNATELIDVNRHNIINKSYIIQKVTRKATLKPFVFICNKN
jgi:hypothetical protein